MEDLLTNHELTPARSGSSPRTSGRNEGTISVNYYYAAKKHGAKPRRRGRPAGKRAVAARTAGQGRVLSLLKAVAELVRRQAAELEALRRENARFAAVRKLIGAA